MSRAAADISVSPLVEVRGHRAFQASAHPRARAAAVAIDLCAGTALLLVCLLKMSAIPVPSLWWPISGCLLAALLWAGQRLGFGASLGERAWGLRPRRPETDSGLAGKLRWQVEQATSAGALLSPGTILTLAALVLVPLEGWALFSSHPIWLRAELLKEAPIDPARLFPAEAASSVEESERINALETTPWVVSPFYYALGAWPALFEGNPVFFNVPYEKGPPSRFIGHMVARWDSPAIRLTFEGPRTPAVFSGGTVTRADLEVCLAGSILQSPSCLGARRAALGRQISEMMAAIQPRSWSLKWLVIDNPALASADRVQGVYLTARGDTQAQDRFVLVLPNGAEQTMTLDYPLSERGEKARELFMTSIRTLQVSPDLAQGIRWADREIENVRLDDLQSITDPGRLAARLARIQSVLLGKLSVDPRTYDTYFHLAGTASLLAGLAEKQGNSDWISIARPMIRNLLEYAKDVSPDDPRTAQLQKLWLQVKSR